MKKPSRSTVVRALSILSIIFSISAVYISRHETNTVSEVIKIADDMQQAVRIKGTIHTAYMLSTGLMLEAEKYPTADLQNRLDRAGNDNLLSPDSYFIMKDKTDGKEILVPLSQFHTPIIIHENTDSTIYETPIPSKACLLIKNVMNENKPDLIVATCLGTTDTKNSNTTQILQIILPHKTNTNI